MPYNAVTANFVPSCIELLLQKIARKLHIENPRSTVKELVGRDKELQDYLSHDLLALYRDEVTFERMCFKMQNQIKH